MKLLPKYIRRKFLSIFFFCLLSVVLTYLVVDWVQEFDRFIDNHVPTKITMLYYLYYIPYIMVLGMPVATLLATIFSVGGMARQNEIAAMKALGYSLYQVLGILLAVALLISVGTFFLSEGIAAQATQKKEEIRRDYLGRGKISSRLNNLYIQVPPDQIMTIGTYDTRNQIGRRIKIEQYEGNRLLSRLDAPEMAWEDGRWVVRSGYQRFFHGESETAKPILEPIVYDFQFGPDELIKAQIKPEEMSYRELQDFIGRIREVGGEVHQWMTDLHLRISFPLSNFLIVLLSIPIAYNRRKSSVTVAFGISLLVCFFYFGIVKTGQTLGQKGSLDPLFAAWLGNVVMLAGGIVNVAKTRK